MLFPISGSKYDTIVSFHHNFSCPCCSFILTVDGTVDNVWTSVLSVFLMNKVGHECSGRDGQLCAIPAYNRFCLVLEKVCVLLYTVQGWVRVEGRDEVTRELGTRVQSRGLQQVLLLALTGVVPVEEGLLHLSVFVQPTGLMGKIGT